jgi:prepilin-type processing-associated H-X9-DG protein/prepilin-type N-terminal cleavage/methylation domain-containing protein
MRRAGFTIVEILMATVIIAIIAAITLSVLSSATAKASQAVCLSNVGQLTKAILIYADQNDGGTGHTKPVPWVELVLPKRQANIRCPHLKEWDSAGPITTYDMGGYAQNECLDRRMPAVEAERTVLLTEAARFVSPLGRNSGSYQPHSLAGPDVYQLSMENSVGSVFEGYVPDQGFGATRHRGGCNYAMADGHAKWFRPSQLQLPVQGFGCSNLATMELIWTGPENGPFFLRPQ